MAERLLPLYLGRLVNWRAESQMIWELERSRPKLIGGLILKLQRAVRSLQETVNDVHLGKFRMADSAFFMTRVAKGQGKEAIISHILEKLGKEQQSFSIEDDPLVDVLREWASQNQHDEAFRSAIDLYSELQAFCFSRQISLKTIVSSPKAMAQRLSRLRDNVACSVTVRSRKASSNYTKWSVGLAGNHDV